MSDFRKIKAWQKARDLAQSMQTILPRLYRRKRRLADQMERSAESILDAIAEGRGKATDRDFAGFLTTAISSANELENQLQRAVDMNLISEEEHASRTAATIEVRKMLIGYRKTVRGQSKPE